MRDKHCYWTVPRTYYVVWPFLRCHRVNEVTQEARVYLSRRTRGHRSVAANVVGVRTRTGSGKRNIQGVATNGIGPADVVGPLTILKREQKDATNCILVVVVAKNHNHTGSRTHSLTMRCINSFSLFSYSIFVCNMYRLLYSFCETLGNTTESKYEL